MFKSDMMEGPMKKVCVIAMLFTLIGGTLSAETLTFRLGILAPEGKSDIWQQNTLETTLSMNKMISGYLEVAVDLFIQDILNVEFSLGAYEKDRWIEDSEFIWPDGSPIERSIHLSIVPLLISLKLYPFGKNVKVIPYLGGGAGLYFWKFSEDGDFVLDRYFDPFIATGFVEASGQDIGWHAMVGFQIPWGRRTSFDFEARYYKVNGELSEDFDPAFEPIDLSGWIITGGLSIWW